MDNEEYGVNTMPEWLKSLLAAIGGGSVVLVGVLTVFKKLFIKLFETGIEASFEKNLVKFKNKLDRSTRAYEILLDREMRFYERLEPIVAELVPLVHDLRYYLERHEKNKREIECGKYSERFGRYCELTTTLKNENLVHHSYIPQDVFDAFTGVVKQMQNDIYWWSDMAELLFAGDYERIDYEKCEKIVDLLLMQLALAETRVRVRLQKLSGEE